MRWTEGGLLHGDISLWVTVPSASIAYTDRLLIDKFTQIHPHTACNASEVVTSNGELGKLFTSGSGNVASYWRRCLLIKFLFNSVMLFSRSDEILTSSRQFLSRGRQFVPACGKAGLIHANCSNPHRQICFYSRD